MNEAKATPATEPIEELKPFEYLVITATYLLRNEGYSRHNHGGYRTVGETHLEATLFT